MAGIFDSIPVIVPILFVLGVAGVIAYEKFRSGGADQPAAGGTDTAPAPARTAPAGGPGP